MEQNLSSDATQSLQSDVDAEGNSSAPEPLAGALRAAAASPSDDDAWSAVEEAAATLQRPDDVALLYVKVLQKELAPDVIARLGQRAVRFHDEWYENALPLVPVLTRVMDVDPEAEWAFQRLTLLLTNGERWDDLLSLYDRSLVHAKDKSRRIQLLDEAAHIAKDFAGQPDRAIQYLEQLFPLKPSDTQLATALERLFEKQARYQDLIKLWTARLGVLPKDQVAATRARIASCWLENLQRPDEALASVEPLLGESKDDKVAFGLLERIVALPASTADVRHRAVDLLRTRYDAAGRGPDAVRVLGVALGFADHDEQIALERDIVDRLIGLQRDAEAMDHAATLLALVPGDADNRARLATLAARTHRSDRHSDALAAAAAASTDPAVRIGLWVEAANIRCDVLKDEPAAIALYAHVLSAPEADDATLLVVARRQAGLLERAGQPREQLEVLARLARLEPEPTERRNVLGLAARLADVLGETDQALAAWGRRLEEDRQDREALDATVDILDRAQRWDALITALRGRATATDDSVARRADLVRIATIQSAQLSAVGPAIDTWNEIEEAFGQNHETVDALSALLGTAGRSKELAKLLDSAASNESEPVRRAELLYRLGDVQRIQLESNKKATKSYREALESDPRNEGARAGLRALLADEKSIGAAVEALAKAYNATDEWGQMLDIVEARLQVAKTDAARTAVLLEAATIQEQRAGDSTAALGSLRRAFPLSPESTDIEREVLRLAEVTSGWTLAVEAYRDAITASAKDPQRVADLHFQVGTVLEQHLGDLEHALEAYSHVSEIRPDSVDAAASAVRVAARVGRWDAVAHAILGLARARQATQPELFDTVDAIATETGAWDGALSALEDAMRDAAGLPADVAREIESRMAVWHRDRRNDADAAEAALRRAVAHQSTHAETLRMLAELQRRAPGRPLVDTLLLLAETVEHDHLDALYEASQVPLDDAPHARSTLSKLLARASDQWKLSPDTFGTRTPEQFASYALERLVQLHDEAGEHAAAVDLLVEGSRLPFEPEVSRTMRHQAAEIAANKLGDGARAIDLYRGILDEAPSDARAIRQLALLYETHERLADLLALRRHELSLEPPVSRRLELRLDIARVLGVLGDRDARLATLRDNLTEEPGHETSIDEVSRLLEAESNHRMLADLLAEQAAALESRGESSHASRLWALVAGLAESHLDDVPRAIDALRRVVSLGATTEALDALARLHSGRGEHADAVTWLDQRLALTTGEDRSAVVVKLARAHLGTGRNDRALATLEAALAETPGALDVRTLLAELYRTGGAWEPLAKLLHEGADQTDDSAARFAYLRESADIYQRRLMQADVAIPILERAVSLAPQDRSVRTALADALRAATRLEEARAILEGLIAEFGRRRPPERAAVHYSLAQIARARGDATEALAQLDVASSMDMQHPGIARMLGDLARDQGQLDRAEKAYRALLLSVRRQKPEALDAPDGIGASEVLFELYRLAQQQGEADRAREVLESAFETAAQNDVEGRRFETALRTLNDPELLLRSLQNRLARTTNPDAAAAILRDLAAVLTGLGRVSEALDASLKALEGTPGSAALLDASRQLAAQANALPRYADTLSAAAERAREQGELGLACDLFLRLGGLYETELGDLSRAAAMYVAAEATGDRQVEAWRALDRVCAASGDKAGQVRALRQWVNAGVDGDAAIEQLDALYRLAAIELADAALRNDGCEALTWALDREPQYARAAEMLRKAAEEDPTHAQVLTLFERVARASGEPALLLEALERLAALPDASADLLREAVDIAGRLEEHARAEALLRRAIELAREREVLADAVWALVALAEKRKQANDLIEAIRWLREASEAAEPGEAFQLGLEVGALAAGAVNDLALAAETYERLRAKEPGDRNVWEPLLDVYRRLGDKERLAGLIANTLENVYDSSERNRLRMERARLLLEEGGHDEDAIQVLRDILDEDPAATDAAQMLMDRFERTGRFEDLADLVRRQLESARDRADNAQVAAMSVRLGGLLEATSRTEAMDTYRAALDWMPEHRGVLESLVRLYTPEDDQNDRADAMERLLALERGEAASTLCLMLVQLREAQSDEGGIERALDRGFRGAPEHPEIRERLLHWYNDRQDWPHLAATIAFDASSRNEPADAVALYREAAGLYRDQIGDAIGAANALRSARALVPGDLELLKEAALALSMAGEHEAAAAEIASAITHYDSEAEVKADLLRVRAELSLARAEDALAVEDLELALQLGGIAYAPTLAAGLERRRELLQERADAITERAVVFRLLEVLQSIADVERPRQLLTDWVQRDPNDREALRLLARLESEAESWDAAAGAYAALVAVEEGDAQAEAALLLADACERAGRPADAREGLEAVFRAMPAHEAVRDKLRHMYDVIGAHAELAELLLADAEQAKDDATRFPLLRKAGELRLRSVGDAESAIPPLEAALQIKATDHEAIVLLADAYTLAGKVSEASALLDAAIAAHKGRRSKELAALQHRMARVAYAAQDRPVELAWLNVALDSDMQNGQIASELAEVAMELGQNEIALKALRAITLMKVPGPMSRAQAFLRQGMLAQHEGDKRKAVFLAKKALTDDPSLEEAQAFLKQLGE